MQNDMLFRKALSVSGGVITTALIVLALPGQSMAAKATASKPVPGTVAINCGGPKVGSFVADTDFYGGSVAENNMTGKVNTASVKNPAPAAVYFTERYGDLTYAIPKLKKGGAYEVRLHESEDYMTDKGQRTFDVSINGKTVLHNYDIFAETHALYKAVVKQFNTKADSDGRIVIKLISSSPAVNNPKIDGIEVIPIK